MMLWMLKAVSSQGVIWSMSWDREKEEKKEERDEMVAVMFERE